eukprot:TRINITY_DN2111_c0_g3_i1.p1 TRINITY_DN2111_c0_g3~~TRINITY_DN2111_c0_g3_i1.p1  ORF type:complete len:379 (+),score=47.42 TRINITY_DN2111_c0_g3_i1:38-1174(+)
MIDIHQVMGEKCKVDSASLRPGNCDHFMCVSPPDPDGSLKECFYCHESIGADGLVLLPTWAAACRKHARREVLREHPSKAWLTIVPRQEASTCWCLKCKQSIEWRSSLISHHILSIPPPSPIGVSDPKKLTVISVANAVAESHAWHSISLADISIQSYLQYITPNIGLFCPVTGFDPEGTDTPWIMSFYDNLLTASAALPFAVPVKQDEGEFTVIDCELETDKWVNGFVLTSDEDDASGEVIASKLVELVTKFPWYTLTPRHAYNEMDGEWLTVLVPSVGIEQIHGILKKPFSVSKDSCDYHCSEEPIEDNTDSISFCSSEEAENETENVKGWIAFFMDAYRLAVGILAVGKLADTGIDLSTPEAAEIILSEEILNRD